jgi:hypothetical protein
MIAPNPDAAGSDKPDVLAGVVSGVLHGGATEFEVEYKDGQEEICVMNGPLGCGIGALPSGSDEAKELRQQLYALKNKPGKIFYHGMEYVLRVKIWDSFGEDAFRVKITPFKG